MSGTLHQPQILRRERARRKGLNGYIFLSFQLEKEKYIWAEKV